LPKKDIAFVGTALEDLRAFPLNARRQVGFQLDRVQDGLQPDDWKPMPSVGVGVQEIRVRDETGAYRVIYVAKFSDAVYVLHAFQKKTQKTSRGDLDLAIKRFAEVLQEQRK
jgi:phage-related protein